MIGISEALIGQLFLVSAVAVLAGNIGHELNRSTGRDGGTVEDGTPVSAGSPDDIGQTVRLPDHDATAVPVAPRYDRAMTAAPSPAAHRWRGSGPAGR